MGAFRYHIYFPIAILCILVILFKPTVSRLPIPSDCLDSCVCDDIYLHVNCTNAGLTSIPDINNNTRVLILNGNRLTVIRTNFFSRMRNLRYVSLAKNEIDEIQENSFKNQRKLVKLDLSGNRFGEVPSVALQHLRVLNELDLRDNQIRTLSKEPWYNLSRLEFLRLDNNSIQIIPMVMTSQLKRIIEFTISNNKISAISPRQFMNATNLLYLDLSYNQITTKSNSTIIMNKDSYNYHSSEVPTRATEVEYLADNMAEGITLDSLKGLVNLQELDLSGNQMRQLEYGIFNDLSSLEVLTIDENDLELIQDGVFRNQYQLRILSLSQNALSVLPESMFEDLRGLQVLKLIGNKIVDISPLTNVHMFDLQEIYLNNNQIEVVAPQGFASHVNVEKIYLRNNVLKHVPCVRNLSRLSVLDLYRNRIKEITPVKAFEGTAISQLYLSYNRLKSLPFESFLDLKETLVLLTLEGNRYVCDCRLQWIITYSAEYDWLYADTYGYTDFADTMVKCQSPPLIEGKTLYDGVIGVKAVLKKLKCTEYADPYRVMILIIAWSAVVAASLVLFWVYTYYDFKNRFYFRTSKKRYRLVHSSDENDNTSVMGRNSKVRFRSFDSDTEGFVYDEETTV